MVLGLSLSFTGLISAAPVVDAGPPKIIAFPATDLTLFGHASDPGTDVPTVQWTLTSGPAPVRFSAPWALATTVTFTAAGTYTFQLAVSNGTDTVTSSTTVTVNDASSQTAFYVDPTFSSAGNGTAQSPWKSFQDGNPNQNAQWSAINSALATNDVIVYFSARQAGSDTAEEMVGSAGPGSVIRVRRTDKSTHRLTLDGMSKYNTNDVQGLWADYTGWNMMRLTMTGGCCISIGWDDDVQRDYITIRGFEVTGSGGRIRWGGSYSVLENMWVHDVSSLGATVQFNEAVSGSCQLYGIDHDITVRNNVIEVGIGEGIYMAGNYNLDEDGGCTTGPNAGDNHYDILIENNTTMDTGLNGDEGEGIDLKAGLYNVTVRGNTISFTHSGVGTDCSQGSGIDALGQMPLSTHDSNYLIENNVIHDMGCSNGSDSSHGMALGALHSATIRNNIIYNVPSTAAGIVLWTRDSGATPNNQRIRIYNNTVYAAGAGFLFSDFDDAPVLRNNLLVNNDTSIAGDLPGIDSDYNLLSPGDSSLPEGSHSIVLGSTTGILANPDGGDFRLMLESPAVATGVDLSVTGLATDIGGNPRPRGAAWDIGASEFTGLATVSVTPPSDTTQTFTFTASSVNGNQDVAQIGVIFNTALSGVNACYFLYVQAYNLIYLADDKGSWADGGTLGSAATLSNSQCLLDLSASWAAGSVNLSVNVSITFNGGLQDMQNIYMIAANNAGLYSSWQPMGTWTPGPASQLARRPTPLPSRRGVGLTKGRR
jgi:hypothetical protein